MMQINTLLTYGKCFFSGQVPLRAIQVALEGPVLVQTLFFKG